MTFKHVTAPAPVAVLLFLLINESRVSFSIQIVKVNGTSLALQAK